MNPIFDTLNDRQCEAVKHTEGPLLITAGAGSGKTKVLTCRIAHLLELGHRRFSPQIQRAAHQRGL